MLEAGDAHAAPGAHHLRLHGVVVVIGVEDAGVEPTAGPELAPFEGFTESFQVAAPTRRNPQSNWSCVQNDRTRTVLVQRQLPSPLPGRSSLGCPPCRWRSTEPRCSNASPPRRSTCSSSVAGSPAPAWPSTRATRVCARRSSRPTTSPPGRRRRARSSCTAGCATCSSGDVRLVYEALHERQRLRRNAPHLVKLLPFMIPILTKDGLIPRRVARALGSAMWMYDLTGGFRIGKLHKRLKADAAFAHLPTMPRDRVAGGYLYYDATIDDARLVLTLVPHRRRPWRRRRQPLPGRGAEPRPRRAGRRGPGRSRRRRRLRHPGHGGRQRRPGCGPTRCGRWRTPATLDSIRPAKGVHVTVPWEQGAQRHRRGHPGAAGDKRSLFVVPWGAQPDGTFEHTYIGTTDTDYDGPLDDPPCTGDDIDYVLGALNDAITTATSEPIDATITGVWAGLRPLVQVGHQRPHRRPVPPAPRRRRPGRRGRHRRRQADDLPRDGRGHRRHRARDGSAARPAAAPSALLLLGADGYVDRRRAPATPTSPTATARWPRRRRGAHRRRRRRSASR